MPDRLPRIKADIEIMRQIAWKDRRHVYLDPCPSGSDKEWMILEIEQLRIQVSDLERQKQEITDGVPAVVVGHRPDLIPRVIRRPAEEQG